MAVAELNFTSSGRVPARLAGWVPFRKVVSDSFLKKATDNRTVYVIRIWQPIAISYPSCYSPVTYIGRGDFQTRLTNHLRNWLSLLGRNLNEGYFEVRVSTPRARRNVDFYKDVEADLIGIFEEDFGAMPINNARRETHKRNHKYDPAEISSLFGLGRGRRFKWGIWPIGANPLRSNADR